MSPRARVARDLLEVGGCREHQWQGMKVPKRVKTLFVKCLGKQRSDLRWSCILESHNSGGLGPASIPCFDSSIHGDHFTIPTIMLTSLYERTCSVGGGCNLQKTCPLPSFLAAAIICRTYYNKDSACRLTYSQLPDEMFWSSDSPSLDVHITWRFSPLRSAVLHAGDLEGDVDELRLSH